MTRIACWAAALALVSACGSAEETSTQSGSTQGSGGSERPRPHEDDVQIEGLMGTLSADEVQRGLEPRMDRFVQCFTTRYDAVDVLGGEVELAFRVNREGRVRWVYPRSSTVGDRETERCLLDVAARARFPRPHGGEAEFSFPMALDPPDDVRPPFNWESSRVEDVVQQNGHSVASRCSPSGSRPVYRVTAYIAPGGRVIAAGAAIDLADAVDTLDCVADAIREWEMPDPGSYPAKVTFELR